MAQSIIKEEIVIVDVDIQNESSNDCESAEQNNEPYVIADIYLNKSPLKKKAKRRRAAPRAKRKEISKNTTQPKQEPGQEPFVITYKCIVCSLVFTNFMEFQVHLNEHSDLASFTCDECPKRFMNKPDLQEHIRQDHEYRVKPNVVYVNTPVIIPIPVSLYQKTEPDDYSETCDESYIMLEEAKEIQIKMEQEECYQDTMFEEAGDVRIKMEKEECYEDPGESSSLLYQRLTEAEKKVKKEAKPDGFVITYKCIVCATVFTDFMEFQLHLNEHSDLASFACQECPERFMNKPDLQEHIRYAHKCGMKSNVMYVNYSDSYSNF